MTNALTTIIAYKMREVAVGRAAKMPSQTQAQARAADPPRGFADALARAAERDGIALIAEVKKASPSKGLIRETFDPAEHAASYAAGGATCLSVLTDGPSFQGAPEHLNAARAACALPVLRKDFMIDPWQVTQARAMGADAILIIMAAVGDSMALALYSEAKRWNMDVLVEVHDEDELERALKLPVPLIGVNNRDLTTFETTLETTERLAPLVPDDRLLVSESGVFTPGDVARVRDAGAKAILVGESLMRADDPGAAARALLATG